MGALGGQMMKEFVGLRAKACSYFKDNDDKDKRAKGTKKCAIKRNLKFQDYKNCFEAVQIENNINHLEEIKIQADRLKEGQKEFVKNNKLILKTQQRFKSEKDNV